jgi:sirohydrochlorin cobaltochelatase
MKRALVVVSFGTSVDIAFVAISNVEDKLKAAFPDYDFFRSFTSKMIIRKLARTKNITINSPEEVFEKLVAEGYDEVICQPTHIIPGLEYEKMLDMILPYKDDFKSFRVGRPLLTTDVDYVNVAHILMKQVKQPVPADEAFLMMGHGTTHSVDSTYCMMEHVLRDLNYDNTFVGTVEGFPDIHYVLKRFARKKTRKVTMMPMLIVAGDHARNDLAGEGEDSWKSILEREGYETEVIMKGLGEIDDIAEVFADHAREADEQKQVDQK